MLRKDAERSKCAPTVAGGNHTASLLKQADKLQNHGFTHFNPLQQERWRTLYLKVESNATALSQVYTVHTIRATGLQNSKRRLPFPQEPPDHLNWRQASKQIHKEWQDIFSGRPTRNVQGRLNGPGTHPTRPLTDEQGLTYIYTRNPRTLDEKRSKLYSNNRAVTVAHHAVYSSHRWH